MKPTEFLPGLRSLFLDNRQAIIALITSALCLTVLEYYVIRGGFSDRLFARIDSEGIDPALLRLVGWSLGCVVCYLVIPMTVLKLSGERISDYGWSLNEFRDHLPIYLLMYIPVALGVLIVSQRQDFLGKYPFYTDPTTIWNLLIWEVCYALQFVALEFFFRGFMVHSFKQKMGDFGAIAVMVLPYMMIHFPKPYLETIGAIIAGFVLGFVSLRTNSIFGGAMVHIMVAWSMDAIALWKKGWFDS